uniref:Uncharacterized protein n=1 Tax=Oryza barthii TaxID=65489 RepID=A0A0D3EWX3_9ORYZ
MESETSGVVAGRGVAWSRRSAATDEEKEIITRLILGDETTPPLRPSNDRDQAGPPEKGQSEPKR